MAEKARGWLARIGDEFHGCLGSRACVVGGLGIATRWFGANAGDPALVSVVCLSVRDLAPRPKR